MTKRTDFADNVLVSEEDLDNSEKYKTQGIKERLGSSTVGYDSNLSSALVYHGIVKEKSDLRFTGVEDTEYTSTSFTVQTGTSYTRFKEDSDLSTDPYYTGGERSRVTSSQSITIKDQTLSATNYAYLVYVELKKNKKYDESGANSYYVDRQDSWIIVQLSVAEVNTLGKYETSPNGYVDAPSIAIPYLDSQLTSDEKTATFGSWSSPSGVFTISSYRVTHYNSIFLGKILITGVSPTKYKFYHTLSAGDPIAAYTLSRPSFSVVDNYHRNRFGQGTQANANPHAQSVVDLDEFNDTVVDHRNLHHSSGIIPNGTTSLSCVINGTVSPDSVTVTSIASGEYLFLQGKRITSLLSTSVTVSGSAGTYYIYVVDSGTAPTISASSPYESYIGSVLYATSVPSNGFPLCTVYWDGSAELKAFQADPRYSSGSIANPVTDLRVFGMIGYEKYHSTLFENTGRENLIPNGNFEIWEGLTIKGWTPGTRYNDVCSEEGNTALKTTSTNESLTFPFNANKDHAFRARVYTGGASCTYTITLVVYRGRNKTQDEVGTFTLNTETASYSSWAGINSDFLSSSSITFSGSITDRNFVGHAAIRISVSSGTLYISNAVLRPKISVYDLENSSVTTAKLATDSVAADKLQNQCIIASKIDYIFGSWTSLFTQTGLASNFTYGPVAAGSDILICFYFLDAGSAAFTCNAQTPSGTTKLLTSINAASGVSYGCLTLPVKQGQTYYFGITRIGGTCDAVAYWLPIGP